jgi:DnaJ-class molecular chaperone
MKDPYEALGVSRTASEAEIKKAFRSLAKKYHPDAAPPAQRAAAQKRFQEISAAYEIVGDKKKRAEYDAGGFSGGPGGFGQGGFGQGGGFEGYPFGRGKPEDFNFAWGGNAGMHRNEAGFRPEDLFADLLGGLGGMGGRRRGRGHAGQDVNLKMTVGLREAAHGGTRRIRLPGGEEVDVKIPAGLKDGQTIRLKGRGAPGAGGPAGDALIQVAVADDPHFRRDGNDLKTDLAVSLKEAVLGGKVPVETLSGTVFLTVPPGSNSGTVLRLKGKGMPGHGGTTAGDLYVRLIVTLPKDDDADLVRFAERWKADYDPRR